MTSDRGLIIIKIETSIQTIDEVNLPKDAHLKYLLNHLRYYLEKAKNGDWKELINAADKFGMFCTEHMDWDTDEYRTYSKLAEIGRKLAKKEQNNLANK